MPVLNVSAWEGHKRNFNSPASKFLKYKNHAIFIDIYVYFILVSKINVIKMYKI